jgi:UDP-N-acetylmuramoyl-tripeptide--D-alanyl-D-alanine ligase
MNGSRVVGPVIASAVYARTGASLVFLVNAGSYLLVIWSLLTVELPPPVLDPGGPQGFRRLAAGFDVAKRDVVIGRALVTVFLFSLLSLPFIGQLPVLADRNLGIGPRSEQYGYLYACFGTGALLGALSIGTVLAGRSQERITRVGLVLFAGCLAVFSLIRSPGPAYIVIGVLGLFYFAVITSLSTVLQERLDDRNRGRVMALWIMGFGGTVPIGNLIAGPLIEASSITAVVLGGAAIAVALAAYANLHDHARNPRGRPMQILTGDLASVTGGQLQGPDVTVAGASIDSRSIDRGQLFVPIVAERDGHDFIAAALAAGAGAYLTEHEPVGGTAILVGDTAAALRLAGAHARTLLTCPVVGITGSVGKTSVKDLLAATLGSSLRTTASERSFNNELGVPLTLLSAPLDAEAVVVEMGARGFGQIAALCEIARPTIGIVTRVSAAHTEAFGGLDDVARAKGELPAALPKHGTAILFTGDERVLAMRSGTGASVITFGEGGDVRATGVELDDELHPRFRLESPWGAADVRLTVRGVHQVDNALAAAAAALVCDLAPEQVADGLAAAVLSPWRMELATGTTGARVLNDAYNANPASVTAALQALAALPATRRTAVLGVMAELGAGSRKEHAAIGRLAKRLGIRVISVHAPQYGADVDVPDADAAMAELGPLGPEDAVLVKGSRVAGLERLAETLLAP